MFESLTSHSRIGQADSYAATRGPLPPVDPIHPDLDACRLGEICGFGHGTIVSARQPLPTSPRHQFSEATSEVIAVVEIEDGTWICAWIVGCTFDVCAPTTRVTAEPAAAHDGLPAFHLD